MSLTPHVCYELKPLDYGAIIIEFVNCLPTKFNGEILFELPPIHHPLGHSGHSEHSGQLQGMDKMVMLGASCKLLTSRICWKWQNAMDICVVKMIFVLCCNVLLHAMKLFAMVIICNFQYLDNVSWNPWFVPPIVSFAIFHPLTNLQSQNVLCCSQIFKSFKSHDPLGHPCPSSCR